MANRWLAFLAPSPTVSSRPRTAAPQAFTIDLRSRSVEVTIRRNARARRYTLRINPRGDAATVTIPQRGSVAEARAFVGRHAEWLEEKLSPLVTTMAALGAGSLVPVRGVEHRIRPTGALRGTVREFREPGGEPVLLVPGGADHLARRVEDHLRRIARADLGVAVARHAAAIGVTPKAIRLKDTTSRWGSASATGTLSFSWRLAMAPPFVLDYLAAHEVAHLREMNHSHRFWAICRRLAPRTEEAQEWLKQYGRSLHRVL